MSNEQNTTTKHTPGPWEMHTLEENRHGYDWTTYTVRSTGNICLAVVGAVDRYCADDNAGNARLMAAAPDLLDALRRIAEGQWPASIEETEGTNAMREVARAAIAKATGVAL